MVSGKQREVRRVIITLLVGCYLLGGAVCSHAGLFWGPDRVVTINQEKFTTEDVKAWWGNWGEKDASFPETAEPFINWQLLTREADRMGLHQEPSFQHKIKVFLKVRSLLQYRYDQVNSKIKITNDELRDYYQEKYLPRLELGIIFFNDKEKIDKAAAMIKKDGVSLKKYAEARPDEKGKTFFFQEKTIRQNYLEDKWKTILAEMEEGEISSPFAWSEGFAILELKKKKGGDPDDFQKLRGRMKKELHEQEESNLTVELIKRLKDRYNVRIDREILNQIDLDSDNKEIQDQVLISIGDTDYPVKVFLATLEKQKRTQRKYGQSVEDAEAFKSKILNGVISQTLITRASLDEHYEEKEPLKTTYLFYRNHRLIKELEKRIFLPKTSVTDKEIRDYYEEYIDNFSSPQTVTITLIQDEQKLVDKMYGDIKRGLSFYEVADKYFAERPPEKKMQFNRLEPEVRNILNTLATGEVSKPFELHGRHAFLKLISRSPAKPMPIKHVREKIVSLLEDKKFEEARQKFLVKLKKRSEITVDEAVWNRLKKEIGNPDA